MPHPQVLNSKIGTIFKCFLAENNIFFISKETQTENRKYRRHWLQCVVYTVYLYYCIPLYQLLSPSAAR